MEEPVSGSFARFVYKYRGPFVDFLSGWNYWVMFVLVGMAELTVTGIYIQYWLPDVPTRVWVTALFLITNTVNLVNARLYDEAEFWFALIKALVIIGMITSGLWMLFDGHGGNKTGFDNLWKHGGFFATGWYGPILLPAVIMFPFGGLEFTGITITGVQNPEKSIPKAVNQVVYRILLFYIGSLVVLPAFYPWAEIRSDSSPFVMILHHLDSNLMTSALSSVILIASLLVYNSGVYPNSRMLSGLLVQDNAPTFLARVSERGMPVNSLLLSGIIASLVVVLNYLLPHEAPELLMALVVAMLLLNQIMICMAHLKFRAIQRRKGRESKFEALLALVSNYFYIAFLGLILVLMCIIDGMRLSVILLPVWILFLLITLRLLRCPV